MTKLNFLAVYTKAHVRAFTENNIRAAFAKTGIVPYNPNVVTVEMMAPSLETSTTSLLPLGLASPVREVVDLISHHNAQKRKRQDMEEESEAVSIAASDPSSSYTPVRQALASLATTSASFLVLDSPILSTSKLPPILTTLMSPPTRQDTMILDAEPSTELEAKLQEALCTSNAIIEAQKKIMGGMQAQTVLQSIYLEGVQGQLQAQEVKKAKKRKTGKINMDG